MVQRQDILAEVLVALDGGDVEASVSLWSCPEQHARAIKSQ